MKLLFVENSAYLTCIRIRSPSVPGYMNTKIIKIKISVIPGIPGNIEKKNPGFLGLSFGTGIGNPTFDLFQCSMNIENGLFMNVENSVVSNFFQFTFFADKIDLIIQFIFRSL